MSRYLFFSGKGGVGKTSMACTTAVQYADAGLRTLIVTTDPASNLADVYGQPIGHHVTPIAGVANLWAMEIDSDAATEEYIERAMTPLRAALPAPIVAVMEEQMSGPCTTEVAAFDRFVDFLEPQQGEGAFDVVIFDTAPTGHTLRLLELPSEWSDSITNAEQGSGQTCIGPTAAIQGAKAKYERALATLRDGTQTTFTFVLHPEGTSIQETERAIGELRALGIAAFDLIVNGVIPEEADGLFAARRAMQQGYLAQIAARFAVPMRYMPLLSHEIRGMEALRGAGRQLFDGVNAPTEAGATESAPPPTVFEAEAGELILRRLLPEKGTRLLFFAGKGGVGKSVAACMSAVWLARRGVKTLLLTTDPAAHLGAILGNPVTDEVRPVPEVAGLWATKIDPKAAVAAYKARILDEARARGRSAAAIAVMAEELESPCTEEMAAFDRFLEYATEDGWEVVVFDTAPTGHTLRLLELPFDWSKQLDLKAGTAIQVDTADAAAQARFGRVIEAMRDPARTTFAFVVYPELTPIVEAERAGAELGTLGIRTGLVLANFVVPPEAATTPFGRARRAMQQRYLAQIRARFDAPVVEIPLQADEVRGVARLEALAREVYEGVALAV